jgi:hypothetical protein
MVSDGSGGFQMAVDLAQGSFEDQQEVATLNGRDYLTYPIKAKSEVMANGAPFTMALTIKIGEDGRKKASAHMTIGEHNTEAAVDVGDDAYVDTEDAE